MAHDHLTVVVAAFNEADSLPLLQPRIAAALDEVLAEHAVVGRVLYVDDGSSDGTWPVLQAMAAADPRIALLRLSRNFGKELALTAGLDRVTRQALRSLPGLYGDASVLALARAALPGHPEILAALDDLACLSRDNGLPVSIDLADLRGYRYHSGVVFSAYAPGWPNAVALGGRYDEVGKAFGRARPATGFSMDLRDLAQVAPAMPDPMGIRAPHAQDPALVAQIERLRDGGEVVVVELPGHEGCGAGACDRELARVDGKWQVRKLD